MWPKYKLSKILSLEYGKSLPKAKRNETGTTPVAGSNGADGFHNKELVEGPGVIVGRKGSAGKVTWYETGFWPIDTTFYVKPKTELDLRWVYYLLDQMNLDRFSIVTGVPGLNRQDAYTQEILLPPPSEQRRIVEILDQADRLRKLRAEADKKAERILPALFIKMFGDPATNPMGWDTNDTFGDVGTLDRGKSRHRPRNAPELLGGDHPLIQTGDVANSGGRIRNHTQTYSDIGLAQSKMWPKGTLCITIAANIAKTGVLEFDACFPDSVVGFHPGPDVTTEYVQSWLYFLQPVLENNAPQAAQKNINLQVLRSLPLPKPPLPLQEKFSSMVVEYYKQIDNQLHQGERLETLFNSILHRAFTGDLTASWRQDHMKELLQEMELQAKVLAI